MDENKEIKIQDLPADTTVTREEMDAVCGGAIAGVQIDPLLGQVAAPKKCAGMTSLNIAGKKCAGALGL